MMEGLKVKPGRLEGEASAAFMHTYMHAYTYICIHTHAYPGAQLRAHEHTHAQPPTREREREFEARSLLWNTATEKRFGFARDPL